MEKFNVDVAGIPYTVDAANADDAWIKANELHANRAQPSAAVKQPLVTRDMENAISRIPGIQPNGPRTPVTLQDRLMGIVETPAILAGSLGRAVASPIARMYGEAYGGQGTPQGREAGQEAAKQTEAQFYQPRTQSGPEIIDALSRVLGSIPPTPLTSAGTALSTLSGPALTQTLTRIPTMVGQAATSASKIPSVVQQAAIFASEIPSNVADNVAAVFKSSDAKLANKIANQLGIPREELLSALTQSGPQLIPGYQKTVPQILQKPFLSQIQRNLQTSGASNLTDAQRLQQDQMAQALTRVAPSQPSVFDAAQRTGAAIEDYGKLARDAASKKVRIAFESIDPNNETALYLPISKMENSLNKYLGEGTFGTGNKATEAINTAKRVGTETIGEGKAAKIIPKTVPYQTVQNLRRSMGEAAENARAKGANNEATALDEMIRSLDKQVNQASGNRVQVGEYFPKDAANRYRDALDAHIAKIEQFGTGPQVSMFRRGGDNQASIKGAEIPSKFYSGALSQADDIKAFKKLVDNKPDLINEMKSFAMTQAEATRNNTSGDLGDKYLRWVTSRTGANAELLNPSELATVKEVGKMVQNQMVTDALGRVKNSDTAQKFKTMNSNGLLDSQIADFLVKKIPVVGDRTGQELNQMRIDASQRKNEALARLLANPDAFAKALKE